MILLFLMKRTLPPPPMSAAHVCGDPASKVAPEELEANLALVNEGGTKAIWVLEDEGQSKALKRRFVCKNFVTALAALNAFGEIAEEFGHHPDLHLTQYRQVEVVLYSHSLESIIKTDFDMAAAFNKVDIEFSPKWARENPMSVPSVVASADAASIN